MDHHVREPLLFERKDDILILHFRWPPELIEVFRSPRFYEGQQSLETCVLASFKLAQVTISKGLQADHSILSFCGSYTESKGGIVPKKKRPRRYPWPLE
jgi:hypothetical protein